MNRNTPTENKVVDSEDLSLDALDEFLKGLDENTLKAITNVATSSEGADTIPKDTTPKDTTPKDTIPKDTIPKDTTSKDTTPDIGLMSIGALLGSLTPVFDIEATRRSASIPARAVSSGVVPPSKRGALGGVLQQPTFKKSNKRVLAIDADSLMYAVATAMRESVSLDSSNISSFIDGNFEVKPPYIGANFDEIFRDGRVVYVDKEQYRYQLSVSISRLIDIVAPDYTYIAVTVGRTNFRYDVSPLYKANRTKLDSYIGEKLYRIPLHKAFYKIWNEVLDDFDKEENIEVVRCTDWEADDEVVYIASKHKECIVACKDKDIYPQLIQGEFYHYGKKDFVNLYQDDIDVFRNACKQCLIGDRGDNIRGVDGIGVSGADRYLKPMLTKSSIWRKTLRLFIDNGRARDEAVKTMQLVNMHQLQDTPTGKKIVLWTPDQII